MRSFIKFIAISLCLQADNLLQAEQPITLFCHGIMDNQSQADRYEEFLQHPYQSFDFPDAQEPSGWNFNSFIFSSCAFFGKKPINIEKMYMGYGPDIQTLQNQIDLEKSYILYGFSRGGATILNYLSKYNPDNVKALILNAAPADMVQSVDTLQYAINYKFAQTRSEKENIFKTIFPAYQIDSTPPVQAIAQIKNKNLPVFIVHAQTDEVVHISSAWQLYLAFLQAGYTHVYFCELESGQHKAYPKSPDKNQYLQALHSFYKKYNLSYNPEFATLTEQELKQLQPTVEEITKKLKAHQEALEKTYQETRINRISTATNIRAFLIIWLTLVILNRINEFK